MNPWHLQWAKKKIKIERNWGGGGNHLKNPNNKLGVFSLKPIYFGRGSKRILLQFAVTFAPGAMKANWKGLLMTPRGAVPPPLIIPPLPVWKASLPFKDKKRWRRVTTTIVQRLRAEGCRMQRLEALFAASEQGEVAIDMLRMAYLRHAVVGQRDLIVISFKYLESNSDVAVSTQNGGGSGPP